MRNDGGNADVTDFLVALQKKKEEAIRLKQQAEKDEDEDVKKKQRSPAKQDRDKNSKQVFDKDGKLIPSWRPDRK